MEEAIYIIFILEKPGICGQIVIWIKHGFELWGSIQAFKAIPYQYVIFA